MAEVLFRARLTRDDSATPWGFRLQGGADYKKPLTLLKVVEGSVAAKSGLHPTDIVVKLAGQSADGMTHRGAQEAIMASGNALEIIVERADVTISSPPNTPQPQKASRKLGAEKRPESPAKKVATESKMEESRKASPTQPQPASQPLSQSPPQQSTGPGSKPPIAGASIGAPSIVLPPVATPAVIAAAGAALATDPSSDSSLYIPDSNNNQQLAESLEREMMFVKDPSEFQVNPFHKPGARRTSSPPGLTPSTTPSTREEDTSSDPSSSGSTDSLDSVPEDGAGPTHQVQEEKLLATKDDAWTTTRRSSRSPVPPGGEAWRREETLIRDAASQNRGVQGGEPGAADGAQEEGEEGENRAGLYSEVSTTEVKLVTMIEQQPLREPGGEAGRGEGAGYGVLQGQEEGLPLAGDADNTAIVYHWRLAGRRESGDDLVEDGSPGEGHQHRSSNRRAWERLSRTSGGSDDVMIHNESGSGGSSGSSSRVGGDDVLTTSEGDNDNSDATTPTLTFVGRRLAPPTLAVEGVVTTAGAGPDTPTAKPSSPSPHISVTPSSPPTGLTVLPLSQYQKYHLPDNHNNDHPSPLLSYDLPQLTRDMSEIQLEALRLMSNNEYHSPRLDDIHFSTGGPEVVDIPMPAVKEMVEDLNRRLEAIAAQQPRIAQPPTAQELGLSFIRQRRKELEQEQEEQESAEREIFIDMPPAPSIGGTLEGYQGYFRNEAPPGGVAATTNTYQKLYDLASPIHSPTPPGVHPGRGYEPGRGPSPRNQRRVHFAEPPEQSVIEIEARSKRRGNHRNKDRPLENELPPQEAGLGAYQRAPLPAYSSHSLPEALNGSNRYQMPGGMVSSPPLMAYESATLPVMIERPAGARPSLPLPHPPSPVPGGYESPQQHPYTSAPSPSGGSGHPAGQFSVSITHKKADQSMPTRLAFTLPSGQPGQPTHFRYTMAGTHSPQQQQQLQQQLQQQQQQQQHSRSDAGLTYSLPPRYEDSVKMMGGGGAGVSAYGRRSFDDSYLPRPGSHHLMHRTSAGRAVSPQPASSYPLHPPRRHPSPLYVETAGGPLSPPRASPVYTPTPPPGSRPRAGSAAEPYVNPIRGVSPSVDDAVQSKSFRALEAHYTDGGKHFDTSRVQILGTPSQGGHEKVADDPPTKPYVLQPAAVGRPFNQLQPSLPGPPEVRPFTPPPPQGALPGPPPPGVDLAGAAIGPGLFALFDSSFTDKFMQWQQSPRSHFESETYKLVHEMEGGGGRRPGRGGKYQ